MTWGVDVFKLRNWALLRQVLHSHHDWSRDSELELSGFVIHLETWVDQLNLGDGFFGVLAKIFNIFVAGAELLVEASPRDGDSPGSSSRWWWSLATSLLNHV